ncbi:MAG: oligosaccharide repeat unit polymerase [Rhodospirillales bacterium]|nr:oligosaccharide repeat unit polymerase [Rhodospirillales bacterium]
MNPSIAAVAIVVPLLTAALLVTEDFHAYFGRPHKFLTPQYFFLGLCGVSLFWLGAYVAAKIGSGGARSSARADEIFLLHGAHIITLSRIILMLALGSYALYLSPLAANPDLLLDIFRGDPGADYVSMEMKEHVRIPGVTSLTQLGIVYVVLFLVRRLYLPKVTIPAIERLAFAALIGLAVIRSVVYSERLAAIELLLPAVVLLCRRPKLSGATLAVMPIIGVLLLFSYFATLEFLRSWQDHYKYIEADFIQFASTRLFGYYINALDTGAGFLDHMGGGIGPVVTLQWLWAFPINFGQSTLLATIGFDVFSYNDFLYYYANGEFNNGSGLFAPFLDFGIAGGAICWLGLGVISGALFRSYLDGGLMGLLLYPSWYTSVVEIPRIFNFSNTRYFPALVVSIIIILWLSLSRRPAASPSVRRSLGA